MGDLRSLAALFGMRVADFFKDDEAAPPIREGRRARSEGLEPPTCCFGVSGCAHDRDEVCCKLDGCHECHEPHLEVVNTDDLADVIEIFSGRQVLL